MQDFANAVHDAIARVSVDDKEDFPFRHHLGASVLGKGCDRYLWYSFRWIKTPEHSSRIRRLFRRGHREEARILSMLKSTGLTVSTTLNELCINLNLPVEPNSVDVMRNYGLNVYKPNEIKENEQIKVNFPPHLGGSMDGILHVPSNFVGIYGYFMPIEVKTHNQRSFSGVKKNNDSLRWNVPQHYVQGNAYATRTGCTNFLYVAENKNDDELYLRVEQAEESITILNVARGESIVYREYEAETEKTQEKWRCRMCEYSNICHRKKKDEIDVAVNCRTCSNARPMDDGNWMCTAHHTYIEQYSEIDVAQQCPQYARIIV